jgi:mRNA interferase HigB
VHVITRQRLNEFCTTHTDAREPLAVWYRVMRAKRYASSHELRADFPTASFLGAYRTVFNVGGNKYRLVVDMRYDLGRVYIRHVLTHEEYDRRNKAGTL